MNKQIINYEKECEKQSKLPEVGLKKNVDLALDAYKRLVKCANTDAKFTKKEMNVLFKISDLINATCIHDENEIELKKDKYAILNEGINIRPLTKKKYYKKAKKAFINSCVKNFRRTQKL